MLLARAAGQMAFSLGADDRGEALTLYFRGRLTFEDAQALWDGIWREVSSLERPRVVRFDLSGVDHADGAAIAVLVEARSRLEACGLTPEFIGASGKTAELLRVYWSGAVCFSNGREDRKAKTVLGRIGRKTVALLREFQLWFAFLGALTVSTVSLLRKPRTANWRDLAPLMDRAGAGAVPIVFVINFLIGIITAYQFGVALKQFGAANYVPDFVCLAITRELGPLMTSIVVTGRSGAAFAAELGSMAASDEIDALRALRIDPLRFLVIPRVVALALTLPLLTVLADVMGMLGGLAVAAMRLDMSSYAYFMEARTVVFAKDISFGLTKSFLFALTISMIACQQGLAASGGASGVGKRTTSSVVTALFALIGIDAIFAPRP
jgi:phospholipid/cholesterol/gamma-HCH transport system permease protein